MTLSAKRIEVWRAELIDMDSRTNQAAASPADRHAGPRPTPVDDVFGQAGL